MDKKIRKRNKTYREEEIMDKDFITITNEDIWNKLVNLEKKMDTYNGKSKLNTWMSTTALGLSVGIIFGVLL